MTLLGFTSKSKTLNDIYTYKQKNLASMREYAQTRLQEVRLQIEAQDISRATRRILDLFLDFSLSRSLRHEAVALRAAYNDYAVKDSQTVADKEFQTLVQKAFDLLAEIEKELLPATAEPPKPVENTIPFASNMRAENTDKPIVFQAKNLTKTFTSSGHTFCLPPVNIELRAGEITGIVGENGNGKTTLLRMIAGDLEADGGKLSYPLFQKETFDWYDIKNKIGYIPQNVPKWTGYLKTNLHFTAAIHGIQGEQNEEQVAFTIHRLGLTRYENAKWSEISGGYKLRFELARTLVWRPTLLIIDEPLAHLDINAQKVFMQDIRYLASSSQHPMAVLISSQHLHEVESIADNILFIKNGELLYNGKMSEFGNDRSENLYEIMTLAERSDLEMAFKDISGVKISDVGQMKTIHTPTDVKAVQVMATLANHNIDIQYFRDISTSTLKLFRDNA